MPEPIELDLTDLAQDIEDLVMEHLDLDEKPGVAVCLTLPPGYDDVYWITNVKRRQGIMLFRATAEKMQSQIN